MIGKYAPLRAYLEGVPSSKREISLNFKEIEQILLARLPKSATEHRAWWANELRGSRARSWLDAGFIVDTVDQQRKLVTFKRCTKMVRRWRRKGVGATTMKKRKQPAAPVLDKVLLDAGFIRVGEWKLIDGKIRLVGDISKRPAVYAHIVDGKVLYVGSATRSLKQRTYFYEKPGRTQRTSNRINQLLQEQLSQGLAAWIVAAFPEPGTWNSLPVDMVTGLEGGLIKLLAPPWNMRGT